MNETGKTVGRRPRVLVEAPPYPWHYLIKEADTLFYCDVTVCGGSACADEPCPVAQGRLCPMAGEADAIVAGLGLDTDQGRAIMRGLRDAYPDTPIVVPVWRADTTSHADLLSGCHLVVFPWTIKKFAAAVHDVVAPNMSEP